VATTRRKRCWRYGRSCAPERRTLHNVVGKGNLGNADHRTTIQDVRPTQVADPELVSGASESKLPPAMISTIFEVGKRRRFLRRATCSNMLDGRGQCLPDSDGPGAGRIYRAWQPVQERWHQPGARELVVQRAEGDRFLIAYWPTNRVRRAQIIEHECGTRPRFANPFGDRGGVG